MPIVNYVREHTRFIEYASDEGLTTNEMIFWYALMHIFNQRAEGSEWSGDFIRIDNSRLLTYCPMGYDAMAKARNRLKQRGLIDFKSGDRNRTSPCYKMNYFYPDCCPSKTDKTEDYPSKTDKNGERSDFYPSKTDKTGFCPIKTDNMRGNMGGNMRGNMGGNVRGNPGGIQGDNIYKLKYKDKYIRDEEEHDEEDDFSAGAGAREEGDSIEDRREREESVRDALSHAFGREAYPAQVERLAVAGWRMKFSPEMVNRAIHIAATDGAQDPVRYTLAILEDWRSESVMQPHQVDEYLLEREIRAGKGNILLSAKDPAEEWERRKEAKRQRIAENREIGIEPWYEPMEG